MCMAVSCKLLYLTYKARIVSYVDRSRKRSGKRNGHHISNIRVVFRGFVLHPLLREY